MISIELLRRYPFFAGFTREHIDDLVPPLGHGRAYTFPDIPFLQWQYETSVGCSAVS